MKTVRTTLTLDPDVAEKVKGEMRRTGGSFKETVNTILRRGLVSGGSTAPGKPFKVKARDMGLRPGLSYDKVWDLVEFSEGPLYR